MHVPEVDPSQIAGATVPLVIAYLRHVGGRIVEKGRDELDGIILGRLETLYERVKARLAGEAFAGEALQRLEEDPDNERRRSAFEGALGEVIEADPAFLADLGDAIDEIRRMGALTQISDSGATAVQGNVLLTGRNVAGRDLTVGFDRATDTRE